MKELKGGAPQQGLFTKSWTLEVEANKPEVTEGRSITADFQSTIVTLETQKRSLDKVLSLSSWLKESNNHESKKWRKSVEDLGERGRNGD